MISKMSDADYFAHPAISNSGLKLISKSPAHFKSYKQEDTKALILGSAVHCSILEPRVFFDRYAVMPEGLDRRTKEGKATYEALLTSGKTLLSHDDVAMIDNVTLSVMTHESAPKLLASGDAEMAVITEIDGIDCRAKIDFLCKNGVIVDLKTTEDASPNGFARSVANYGYHRQAAFYIDCLAAEGITVPAFIFIVVEKSAPYAVGIYQLDDASIEKGRELNQQAMSIYRHCLATDEWHAYDPSIITLSLPNWAMAQAA